MEEEDIRNANWPISRPVCMKLAGILDRGLECEHLLKWRYRTVQDGCKHT